MSNGEQLAPGGDSVSEARSPISTEIDRQVDKLIAFGFHKELGLSEDDYRKSFVHPSEDDLKAPTPEYGGLNFDTPVIVDPRVSFERAAALLLVDVPTYFAARATDVKTPYLIWIPNPKVLPKLSTTEIFEEMHRIRYQTGTRDKSIARGADTTFLGEALSTYIHYPEVLDEGQNVILAQKELRHEGRAAYGLGRKQDDTLGLFGYHFDSVQPILLRSNQLVSLAVPPVK